MLFLNWEVLDWESANGVRLVLLALSNTACANANNTDNANNASLTPLFAFILPWTPGCSCWFVKKEHIYDHGC